MTEKMQLRNHAHGPRVGGQAADCLLPEGQGGKNYNDALECRQLVAGDDPQNRYSVASNHELNAMCEHARGVAWRTLCKNTTMELSRH